LADVPVRGLAAVDKEVGGAGSNRIDDLAELRHVGPLRVPFHAPSHRDAPLTAECVVSLSKQGLGPNALRELRTRQNAVVIDVREAIVVREITGGRR